MTKGSEGVSIKMNRAERYQFKNWKQNDIEANLEYLQCGSSSSLGLESTNIKFNVLWRDVTNGGNELLLEQNEYDKKVSVFTNRISQFDPGNYKVKIDLSLSSNPDIKTSITFDMSYEMTPLSLYIKGGNRMTGYGDVLTLEGVAKDLDALKAEQELNINVSNII